MLLRLLKLRAALQILLLTPAACGGARSAGQQSAALPLNLTRLGRPEIGAKGSTYDALMRLRPALNDWRAVLVTEGAIYLDDERLGSVYELRSVPVGAVYEIRFLNAAQASTRYRTGYQKGAIVVSTRLTR
jgi:hypothetical protein